MSALTFTPGKFYKTRDGQKCEVALTGRNFGDGYTMLVIAVRADGSEYTSTRTANGHLLATHEHHTDLIAEWVDAPEVDWSKMPEGANYVTIDEDGSADAWEEKPYSRTSMWVSTFGDSWKLYPQHVPKWSGDWRDSLVTRPTEGRK